jgi:hypothetical protein
VRHRRSGRRRLSGGRIVRLFLIAVLVLFLGWWSVRMAAVDAVVRRNPFLAAAIAPEHPRVKMALARAEFELRQGRVSEAGRQGAIDALRRSALSEDPFLLAGVQAIADGDGRRGEALLEEARRRNPRSRLTRLILLDRYLRANRVDQAGLEMATLTRLVPQAAAVLAPELARMAGDPKTGPGVAEMLGRAPGIRDAVLDQLALAGADPALILRVAAHGPPSPPGTNWQRLLVGHLVSQGRILDGYRLWARFAKIAVPAEGKGLVDPGFADTVGGPPFNWDLVPGGEGVAERAAVPALQVDYYGRAPVTLARQLMMLRPGAYRLQMRVDGDAKGEGSRLSWNLVCVDSKASLFQLPLVGIDSTPRTLAATFTVPNGGCAAQSLSLDGVPGDVPSDQAVTVTALQLKPAAGK